MVLAKAKMLRLLSGILRCAILLFSSSVGFPQERGLVISEPAKADKALPISLDTVLRLAQDRNGQMGIARQRLQEAFAQQDLAAKQWLPELTIGTAYYRHEGGIQDFTGQLIQSSYGSLFAGLEMRGKLDLREAAYKRIDAERKVWQQKSEISRLTSETLLDAAGTYVDLLATRTSELVSLESEKKMADLMELAQTLAKIDSGLRVEVVRLDAETQGQKLITRKTHEGAAQRSRQAQLFAGP